MVRTRNGRFGAATSAIAATAMIVTSLLFGCGTAADNSAQPQTQEAAQTDADKSVDAAEPEATNADAKLVDKDFGSLRLSIPEGFEERGGDSDSVSMFVYDEDPDDKDFWYISIQKVEGMPAARDEQALDDFYGENLIGSFGEEYSSVKVNNDTLQIGNLRGIDISYDKTYAGVVTHNREFAVLDGTTLYRIAITWINQEPDQTKKCWGFVTATEQAVGSISKPKTISVGETVTNEAAEVTLEEARWSDGVVELPRSGGDGTEGVNLFTPRDGSRIYVLQGKIKNTSGEQIDACSMYITFKFNNKYNYTYNISDNIWLAETEPSDGDLTMGFNRIDPMAETTFYVVISVPKDIVNDYKDGVMTLGLANDWRILAGQPSECDDLYTLRIEA